MNELFAELGQPDAQDWQIIEQEIMSSWSKSGSAAMDLLLERGIEAMKAGEMEAAVEHLSALTDHAPDFAEGWNARATAFFHMEEFGASISDIRHVLALNPRHFGALSGLGMILEALGEDAAALAAYRAALAVHPHRPGIIEAEERLARKVTGREL
ncbi:hypothetical protein DDZ14_03455 [Maritimibacter sp. 55A14]|nr:hypothetical protein DDZ14_03455 [Maritimibacter sp. 55A14]